VSKIATALSNALASGLERPKLRLGRLRVQPGGCEQPQRWLRPTSRSHDDVYLGKIIDGKFTRSRDCTDELEQGILAAAADPPRGLPSLTRAPDRRGAPVVAAS
jgi:hypothetical protein